MKKNIFLIIIILLPVLSVAQTVGIGTTASSRAILEVAGNANNNAVGLFGDEQGISVSSNDLSIGFNLYQDKYMSNGYAAKMSYDVNNSLGFQINFYSSGTANSTLGISKPVFRLGPIGASINIGTYSGFALDVGRGTGDWGTATFEGTNYYSHINYSTSEDTYIRGGKPTSNVYLNDGPGNVYIGNGSSVVGVNYTNPVYTFEIRQYGGTGLKVHDIRPSISHTYEWRVAGSPANFYLYNNGSIIYYFRPSDGALIAFSDKRIKKDIQLLPSVLDKIIQLEPVSYEMKDNNPNHIRSTGFIAQQVQPLFPEVVSCDSSEEKKLSINYAGFGAIAVKGIQEEQILIDDLQKQSATIERRLNIIEAIIKEKRSIRK
ncbi:tail fiber domain-containing protein [Ferruginibacter sp. SUN002]|uniref:tail fiber domain-containing protein n=1 Tax=Ferruginibacter sp. SUN002 TaxID=2937789 RepID=UPI003D3618AD